MLEVTIIKETENPSSLETASKIKKLFQEKHSIVDGKVIIACDLTCYGFKEKDIDILVVGRIDKGYLLTQLVTDEEHQTTSKVFISNFCFIIKEINSEEQAVKLDGDRIIITCNGKEFDATSYSETQNNVIRDFIKGTTGIDLFTFDMFHFKNLWPSGELKQRFNSLGPRFSLNNIFQNNIKAGARLYPNNDNTAYNLYAAKKDKLDIDLIEKAVSTFGHLKKSIGYLTKRKLDLLTEQFLKGQNYTEQIGKMPVIIRGPAGSGKTMKLVGIAKDLYQQNKRCLFLTYNQSLVKDLTRLISLAEIKSSIPDQAVLINSIHSLLYQLSYEFGIIQVIFQTRANELKSKFEKYQTAVIEFLIAKVEKENLTNYSDLRKAIDHEGLSVPERKRLSSILNHCQEKYVSLKDVDLVSETKTYYDKIFELVSKSLKEHLFINNFFVIRKEILNFLNGDFKFVVENKLFYAQDFIQFLIKQNVIITDPENAIESFNAYIKRTIRRTRVWDYIFIDEVQDWHREEREIIYSLFGVTNIILSDGLKQQLVRSNEYLDWTTFNKRRLKTDGVSLNKSLRQKENLSRFQNVFAQLTNVPWNVESDIKQTKGRVIVSTIGFTKEIYNSLNQVGLENECDCHDSLMILIPPSLTKRTREQNVYVDEDDDLIDEQQVVEREFANKEVWEKEWEIKIWDGTYVDKEHISKKSLPLPMNEQHRIFHYESSRGLESWTTVCLEMDELYEKKKYYYEPTDGQQSIYSKEEQARMYAANWCLIAMSRAVDTIVITLRDPKSELAGILRGVASETKDIVTWFE